MEVETGYGMVRAFVLMMSSVSDAAWFGRPAEISIRETATRVSAEYARYFAKIKETLDRKAIPRVS